MLFTENPLSVELEGNVGCYSLLVLAVPQCQDQQTVDRVDNPVWFYVAQELRSADDIDGSSMQMILTHRTAERLSVGPCKPLDNDAGKCVSVLKLLQQFPSLSPASLTRLTADPSALLDAHSELFCYLPSCSLTTADD